MMVGLRATLCNIPRCCGAPFKVSTFPAALTEGHFRRCSSRWWMSPCVGVWSLLIVRAHTLRPWLTTCLHAFYVKRGFFTQSYREHTNTGDIKVVFFNRCIKAHSSNSQMPRWQNTRHLTMSTHDTMNGCHNLRMGVISGSSSFRAAFLFWTYFVVVCWNHFRRMRWKKRTHHPSGWRSWNHSISCCVFSRGRPVEVFQMPHVPRFRWNVFNCDNIWWDWPGIGGARTHSPSLQTTEGLAISPVR